MEATRIASRKRILQEDETAEWLNIILFRVWQFHEPLLSANLRQDFLQKLDAVRPSRVLAFEIPLFTLGKKSPFMSSARIITKTPFSDSKVPEDRIVMHLTMGFQAPGLEIVILAKTSYG
jgi:Ca2+-dependent lipid-binding protein